MAYFTLLSRANKTSRWQIEFGDHDEVVVTEERADTYARDFAMSNIKIIKTKTSRQSEIDAKVAALNVGPLGIDGAAVKS